ncbi:cation diffusion facilitator family metal ion [Diplodia corticola]|uniref:Cation diffusion facilitator family metal ion n=1 Tax=Diplodia corticola TaxID=236234 RepID=A0A1J9QXB7_9PEZI|nr:cation diffusion facilitator family metal ion [Diplodia corticola]OJD33670.1 cation diffusion facilitator family metal ion [Diplodia corticola]
MFKSLNRKQRLSLTIAISFTFFAAEISAGFYTRSLALVADAFHYMNDLIGFIVALAAVQATERGSSPQGFSFGWARAQLLGGFFNGVFLLALGVSIFLQSIERFIALERINNPLVVLIVGCVGLTLNIITAAFLHEHDHDHGHGGHPHSHEDAEEQANSTELPNLDHAEHIHRTTQLKPPGYDLGMMGVIVHVLGDACNNVAVIVAALIIWLVKADARFYADPALSTVIAIMILASSIPLTHRTALILLESAPPGVRLADVQHDLELIPAVHSVHELHIWRLDQRKAIASAHVVLENVDADARDGDGDRDGTASLAAFMRMAQTVAECLHAYGIHSATLQPELMVGEGEGERGGCGGGLDGGVEVDGAAAGGDHQALLFTTYAMASSLEYDDSIYLGVWTNWEHGKTLGVTLTVTRAHGNLLIAFLSLFVTIAGTSFWRISCFAMHYMYSAKTPQDGLYHQRQAILRNAANGATGLWSFFQVLYAWRRTANKPCRRILPLIAFTSMALVAFALASIYSSRISTTTGNQVMLSGGGCGKVDIWDSPSTDLYRAYLPYMFQAISTSAGYAQECYLNDLAGVGCERFMKRNIAATVDRNATCPFSPDICKSQDSNLLIDTGFIDSRSDLGINTDQNGRFLYRRTLHCAPLVTEGYAVKRPQMNATGAEEDVMQYFYGEVYARYGTPANHTYQYPIRPRPVNSEDAILDFTVWIVYAASINGSWGPNPTYKPIPALDRKDSTVTLIFLSTNQVDFMSNSGDVWYSTNTLISNQSKTFDPMYAGDQPASPLACVSQHQLCNPNLAPPPGGRPGPAPTAATCTPPFSSWPDSLRHVAHLWPSPSHRAAMTWSYEHALRLENDIVGVLGKLSAAALDSSATRALGVQSPIARNQWQRDVERFHNVSMAGVQRLFVEAATGPLDPAVRAFSVRPPGGTGSGSAGAGALCGSQMIRSSAHANFSVLGLALVFGVGGALIVASYVLEPAVLWIQVRCKLDAYARFEWTMNETLQLQRQAHEGLEIGSWSGCDKGIPVAGSRDRLAVIDLEDLAHPRLKAPPPRPLVGELLPGAVDETGGRVMGVETDGRWEHARETAEPGLV